MKVGSRQRRQGSFEECAYSWLPLPPSASLCFDPQYVFFHPNLS